MKTILGLILFLSTTTLFAQSKEDLIKQFQKERMQMMRQMMKAFQDDFAGDSFFNDDFDPFGRIGKSNLMGGRNIEITEEMQANGDIHILIVPKNKNITMDIQTSDNFITITTEVKIEEETKQNGSSFKSYRSSSSSQSIGIPHGYKVKSSKAQGKGIKIILSPGKKIKDIMPQKKLDNKLNKKPKKKNEIKKYPLEKQAGEEII